MKLAPLLDNIKWDAPAEGRVWAVPLTLPSAFTASQRMALDLNMLAAVETKLRIGNGHDILEKLRKALGLRSFLTRSARNQRAGYKGYTRSQAEIRRAQSIVKQWGHAYRRNWAALVALDVTGPILRGLQELKSDDLKLLGAWLEDEQYRNPTANLPWIWRVSPLVREEDNAMDDDELAAMVADWNEEGSCGNLRANIDRAYFFDTNADSDSSCASRMDLRPCYA